MWFGWIHTTIKVFFLQVSLQTLSFSPVVKSVLSTVFSSFCSLVSSSFYLFSFSMLPLGPFCPFSILRIITLYNKKAVSCALWNLFGSVSRIAATDVDAVLYKSPIWFHIQVVIFNIYCGGIWSFILRTKTLKPTLVYNNELRKFLLIITDL